jgi:hypothetical protein
MVISCDNNADFTFENISFGNTERTFIYQPNIGVPGFIQYNNGQYLIIDTRPTNEKFIKVLDTSFRIVHELGRRGDGPGELNFAPGYVPHTPFSDNDLFALLDGFELYIFEGLNAGKFEVNTAQYPKNYHLPPQHYLFVNDSLLWINGGSELNRFFIFNLNSGDIIKEIKHFPFAENYSQRMRRFDFNAHAVFDPYNNQVIWTYNRFNLIEIYSPVGDLVSQIFLDGELIDISTFPQGEKPIYFSNPIAFKNGFVVACMDQEAVEEVNQFMNEDRMSEYNPENLHKWILVYDVNGNELGRVRTPNFTAFCINEDENLMVFTYSGREDYPLFTLPIPDIIKQIF